MMEVDFKAFIFSPGLHARGGSQPLVSIPLLEPSFSLIGANRRKNKPANVMELPHRVLILRPDLISQVDLSRLGLTERSEQSESILIDALERDNACLTILCLASDGYFGSRRAISSKQYRITDLLHGSFTQGPSLDFLAGTKAT